MSKWPAGRAGTDAVPGLLIGFNELTRTQGNEPSADAIDRAFASVNLGTRLGGFIGRPRVTRELVTDGAVTQRGLYTRAVGLFAVPDTDYGRSHQAFSESQARAQVLAALQRETGSSDWVARPSPTYFPDQHGSVEWWRSGQAAQTSTRSSGMVELFATQVAAERADGPNLPLQGTTYGDAAAGAAQATMERGVLAAQDAAAAVSDAASRAARDNAVPLVLGGLALLGFLWWRYAPRSSPNPRRRQALENPRPPVWDTLQPGTPYGDPSDSTSKYARTKSIGRTTADGLWVVVSRATPTRKRPREGAYLLRSTRGKDEIVLPVSRVSRMLKQRGELVAVPELTDSRSLLEAEAAELARGGFLPFAPGMPFRVPEGSSPCLPGTRVWRELDEAASERAALMYDAMGREPRGYELAAALQNDPAFLAAEKQWRACVKKWQRYEQNRKPKYVEGTAGEVARRRRAAELAGVDLTSAEWKDTLRSREGSFASRKSRSGGVKKSGSRKGRNPFNCRGC